MIQTADRLHTVEEYYFSKKLREVRALMAEGRPIINMGIGSPDLAPSSQVIKSIQNAVFDDGAISIKAIKGCPSFARLLPTFTNRGSV